MGAEFVACNAEQTERDIKLHEAGYNNGVDYRLHGEMSLKAKQFMLEQEQLGLEAELCTGRGLGLGGACLRLHA
eukprot:10383342-Alexandrium_andersonii.AAC.1